MVRLKSHALLPVDGPQESGCAGGERPRLKPFSKTFLFHGPEGPFFHRFFALKREEIEVRHGLSALCGESALLFVSRRYGWKSHLGGVFC